MSNPIIPHDEPATGTAETTKTDGTPKRDLVGIKSNAKHILAYSYANDLDIRCTGDESAPGIWTVRLKSGGNLKLHADVFGGRWLAMKICQYLRNGMVSKRMHKRSNNANRRARAAAALSPEAELAETVKRQKEMEG